MSNYVVVGYKSWNERVFRERIAVLPGEWTYISSREELSVSRLSELAPRYVFFLHWSWIVPSEIFEKFECVVFHMGNLPHGRGGSPLQNLIASGFKTVDFCALRMEQELDAGPVYLRVPLSLDGNAEQILIRASERAAGMIAEIIATEPQPVPQEGPAHVFKRRKPSDSEIVELPSLEAVYDQIRMLDGDGYPAAFVVKDGFRYTIRKANLYEGRVVAEVEITREGG